MICGVLSRKITIGVSVEDENEGMQEEDTAQSHQPSWLGAVPCACTFAPLSAGDRRQLHLPLGN